MPEVDDRPPLSAEQRPAGLRVAIVGAGPSGLFAAQELAAHEAVERIDLYDRLPTPFGLLRYGVAPDHPNIKLVGDALERVLRHDHVNFYGLVDVGTALPVSELRAAYDAVILSFGAGGDLLLGIPGEELHGSRSGREFVEWYGGHPDAAHQSLEGADAVAVVGVGNVAVDVARVVIKDVAALAATDMPEVVLAELDAHRQGVPEGHDVYLIGRRGPQHAAFTTKELRELVDLPGLRVSLSEGALDGIDEDALDRRTRANVEAIRKAVERTAAEPDGDGRWLHLIFWHRPVRLLGDGIVEELICERTALVDGRLVGTGEELALPVRLVLRAVGYRGRALPGVPFDEARGVIPNDAGRVLDEGVPVPGLYTSGWIKRGPSGVIGTNKPDSAETVASLLADLAGASPKRSEKTAERLLAARGLPFAGYQDWLAIDAEERARGAQLGRARTKVATWDELTEIALARAVADAAPGSSG